MESGAASLLADLGHEIPTSLLPSLLTTTLGAATAVWQVGILRAGIAIGAVQTAEHAAVAALAPQELRGSAFGLLAAVQSFGNLAASAIAGLLWTAISPRAAFAYLAAWMALALLGLVPLARPRR